jgi:hypothetical protein
MQRLFRVKSYFCVCVLSSFCISLAAQGSDKPASATAQLTTVRVGAVSIVLPSPASDLVEPGSDYRVLFESFTGPVNRLVAAFVPQDKMDVIRTGSAPVMDKHALVEVARRTEFTAIDESTFQQIAAAATKQLGGDTSALDKQSQDQINNNLKSSGSSAGVTLDKPIQLGTFFSTTDAVGFGSINTYNANGVSSRVVGCMAFVRVRGRILSLFTYATYEDEGTVTWVKTTSKQWAESILKANQ